MALSKTESNINISQSICRLVKLLPTGQVTFGSGCIVILRLEGESRPSAHLITTTQVVTKNHLQGESSIIVQFLDGLQFELKFDSKHAADLPNPIPGRVLEEIEGRGVQVSFITIPVDKFDSRMWIKRKIKPLEKRALRCSHQSDETLQTSISNKHILCHVISDDRKAGRFYITEPSCLSFGKDTSEFALSSISDPDCGSPTKTIKDFPKDEKPKGAPLFNADGRFVGMLAVASSEERKLYPMFLPTLTSDKSITSQGNGKLSNSAMHFLNTSNINGESDKNNRGSDDENASGRNPNDNENNDTSSTKLPSNQTESEANGRGNSTLSEVQGSASPTSNPLHPHSFHQPDYKSLSEASAVGSGSDVEEDQDWQNDRLHRLPEMASNENSSSGSALSPEQDNPSSGNLSLDEPDKQSALEEDFVPFVVATDQQNSIPSNLLQPDNANSESVILPEDSDISPDHSDSVAFDPDQRIDNPMNNYHEPDNTNSGNVLRPEDSDTSSAQDQQDNPGTDAPLDQVDAVPCCVDGTGNNPTRGNSQGSFNENVGDWPSSLNYRPQVMPVQNSHSEQPFQASGLQDDGEVPFPHPVSDPSPPKQTLAFRERNTADLTMHRSNSDVFTSCASSQTNEVAITPRTRHGSALQEHVFSGCSVKEKILSKVCVVDVVCLHLDRCVCPNFRAATHLISRWEHLADYFNVEEKIKRQCKNHAQLSPSEAMFQHLYVSHNRLTIKKLKRYLLDPELARKDVVEELEKKSELHDDATVTDLCDEHPETLCDICLKLDDKGFVRNWYHLGLKIGIKGNTLRSFKDPSGNSPSQFILEKIETMEPNLPLTDIKSALGAIGNVLDDLPDEGTIETILEDLDVVEKITALLDFDEHAWWRFGKTFGMTKLELSSLRQEGPVSPTKLLMEHIVGREPELNMKSFLEALVFIKRKDVVKELKKFYFANDIDAILNLTDVDHELQGQISLL